MTDETKRALALMPLGDVRALAESVSKSKLFAAFHSPEAAFTLMMLAHAEGIHPMQAVKRYDVIQGRPAMKSDAMLADFMAGGGRVAWLQHSAEACEAEFHAPGLAQPLRVLWTLEMATRAGLTSKGGPWKQYPRQMLRARVVSEGVRMAMPGVVAGVYTPEEVGDFEPLPRNVTPAPAPAPALPAAEPEPEAVTPDVFPPAEPPAPAPAPAGPKTAKAASPAQIRKLEATVAECDGDHEMLHDMVAALGVSSVSKLNTEQAAKLIEFWEAVKEGGAVDTLPGANFRKAYKEALSKFSARMAEANAALAPTPAVAPAPATDTDPELGF